MAWFKKLFGQKKESPSVIKDYEEKEIIEEIQEQTINEEENLPLILKDNKGEDLICELCNNEDNETGKYFPIREGDKRKFHSKYWHKRCLRAFQKAGVRGDIL